MSNYIPFILLPVIYFGVIHYLKKRGNYTTLKRITLIIGISAYTITELGRSFYRPYIYAHGIKDYFIADTIGNSFGTVTAIFMILTLSGKGSRKDLPLILVIIAGLLLYEFSNLASNTAVDVHDLIATVIFGAISVLVYLSLLKKYRAGENPV